MANITIQVDPEVAEAYQGAEPQQQQNAVVICNLVLRELLKSASFEEVVQQIRQEASEKGLTAEILEELLKDE